MLFPGFPGVATAVGLFALIWPVVYLKSNGQPVVFDPEGKHGEFGKRLLPMYLDITKFVLGLAAGSIVLLVGSLNFNQSNNRSLKSGCGIVFLRGDCIWGEAEVLIRRRGGAPTRRGQPHSRAASSVHCRNAEVRVLATSDSRNGWASTSNPPRFKTSAQRKSSANSEVTTSRGGHGRLERQATRSRQFPSVKEQ